MKTFKLFVLIFLLIIITACDELDIEYTSNTVVYNDFLSPIEDIELLLNEGFTGFIYFGRDTCPICLQFNEVLKYVCEGNSQIPIYLFDTDFWREDENFTYVLDVYGVTTIPTLLRVGLTNNIETFSIDIDNDDIINALSNFLTY